MKRILTLIALAAAVTVTASCDKEGGKETPTVEFARSFYQLYSDSSVDIVVRLSQPAAQDVTIPLEFGGTAAINEDYTVDSPEVTILAGETEGAVTVSDAVETGTGDGTEEAAAAGEDIEIVISIPAAPQGYTLGTRSSTVVGYNSQEALIYSFEFESADLLDKYIATLTVEGAVSGTSFAFAERTVIPATLSGDGASLCSIEGEGFVFEAGDNTGTLTININDASYAGMAGMTLGVNTAENDRLVAGDYPTMAVTVKGVLSPATLLGTWKFDEVINLEEVNYFFEEMWDDPELLPTHNDGFTLTFGGSDGNYTVTPNDQGDFANYYRTATISHTAPLNPVSGSITLGEYTSDEGQMFVGMLDTPRQQITYFRLSEVNRAFSADTETLGEGTIAMRLRNDGKLEIYIKDYDQPPFGEMWWDGFEPDLFSFASTFTKVE